MFRKTSICTLIAIVFLFQQAFSQTAPKYGHMNLGNLLEVMPETKKANDDLKIFADKLSAKDDSLTKAFETAYRALETEYNSGVLTPVQLQTRQADLQKQQEYIQKFEQEAQQVVAAKREEMLKPILTRIEDAIKAVAKEAGYLMIFDTSAGSMLYAAESDDVSALVKKKLGM